MSTSYHRTHAIRIIFPEVNASVLQNFQAVGEYLPCAVQSAGSGWQSLDGTGRLSRAAGAHAIRDMFSHQ